MNIAETLRELLEWYKTRKDEYELEGQTWRRNAQQARDEAERCEGFVRLYASLIEDTERVLDSKPPEPIPY